VEVQQASQAEADPLLAANAAVIACIGSILSRPDRAVPLEKAKEKVRRAAVHVAVVQGVHIVEYCLATGSYVQAAALIRQELEAPDGLRGIREGQQKDGATPRLKALKHLGRPYSQLTGLAHLSTHDLLAHVTDLFDSGFDHRHNPAFARYLLGLHLAALVGLALDMADLHPFSDHMILSQQEQAWISAVCGVLAEASLLKPAG
jgi:hypothetical protein